MDVSQTGIELIKKYEGCRLEAYKCPAGVLTIGYGHTDGVYAGQKITQAQADELLKKDLIRFTAHVNSYYKYDWTQNEFDALVSFAFNIGSITQLTAKGKRSKDEIANKMTEYVRSGGTVLQGLVKRRAEEKKLFLTKANTPVTGIATFSLSSDGEKSLSKNFKVKEFRCKDGSDQILVDVGFVATHLQAIRDHFNAPVTVNSAYRTQAYNQKVGGAKSSYHMQGRAFDIVVKGYTPKIVARYAQSLGIKGVIQYDSFVHIDSRLTIYHAINHNGKATPVKSF